MRETIKKLREALSKTTKGKWILREHPRCDDAFIQAPEPEGRNFDYAIEVFGEDRNGYDTWREDMEFVIAAHELLPELLELIDPCEKLIKQLGEALNAAQKHLDFCGYGDAWERECAEESGLEDTIQSALNAYEKFE